MAPIRITAKDRFDELFVKITELEKQFEMNEDNRKDLDDQWTRDSYELTMFPMCLQLHHPETAEYKQLQRKQRQLQYSCESAERRVKELKNENVEIKCEIDRLSNEVKQIKF